MQRRLVLVALATAMVGCSSGGGSDADPAATTTPAAAAAAAAADSTSGSTSGSTAAPEGRTSEPDDIVAALVPTDDDLDDGEQVRLREGGGEVDGQVTLDYCGYQFVSESSRSARLQVNVEGPEGDPVASVEAVLYAGGADVALNEVRAAIEDCPDDELVESTVAGVPALRYADTPIPEDQLGDLAEDHVAVTVTATPEDRRPGDPDRGLPAPQRRPGGHLRTRRSEGPRELAASAAQRLAAANPGDLGL